MKAEERERGETGRGRERERDRDFENWSDVSISQKIPATTRNYKK